MSTTTTEPLAPPAVLQPAILSGSPVETAPSATMAEVPTFPRGVGMLGLVLLVLGGAVIIATKATTSPRLISEGLAYLFVALGIALTLYHALRDGEQEIRRMYGAVGGLFILAGLGASIIPGPVFESLGTISKVSGYNMVPWGVGFGLIGLLYLLPFCRNETEKGFRDAAVYSMLAIGSLLTVGSLIAGIAEPDLLAGPGIALAALGIAYLCAYLAQVDTSEGLGFQVATGIGILGGLAVLYVLVRSAAVPMLYDGPGALRLPNGRLGQWAVGFRLVAAGLFGMVAYLGVMGRYSVPVKGALVIIGVVGVGVIGAASFLTTITVAPRPYLIPGGILTAGLGVLLIGIAVGVCSDNPFITLTRRELAAYFLSPIGYLVLAGMAIVQWIGYFLFTGALSIEGTVPEPIVQSYFFTLIPVLCVVLPVPAITMRLLAEERRSGTLEVLLTAPVNEAPVVLSKFLATWLFYLMCWLPTGLYLIALRSEGEAFDYRPLLSFYLALAVASSTMIAVGLFFSSLTRDQIVAAVLTFAVMMVLVVAYLATRMRNLLGPTTQFVVTQLSFLDMFLESLNGQLPLRSLAIWVSASMFFLFLSVKCLEMRKWN